MGSMRKTGEAVDSRTTQSRALLPQIPVISFDDTGFSILDLPRKSCAFQLRDFLKSHCPGMKTASIPRVVLKISRRN